MLVLSRHREESVTIGKMLITIIDIRGDKVRIQITAPKEIPVHRKEVFETERRKNGGAKPPPVPFPSSWEMPKDSSGLVLSRKRDESIIINSEIEIVVVDIRGDKVRLGIDAPTDIPVHRREVYEAIQRANQQSAARPPSQQT